MDRRARALSHSLLTIGLVSFGQPCVSQGDATAAWLFRQQAQDGSWPDQVAGSPDLHTTACAILAILGNGRDTHLRSGDPHRERFVRAVEWLRAQQDATGRFGHRAAPEWVVDHALATFALCEAARLSTEPSDSKYGVAAVAALARELNDAARAPAEVLALSLLCVECTRRFDARMKELAEQYEGWRETLDAQPSWSAGADQLAAEVARIRARVEVGTPREHTAMLIVDALSGDGDTARLAAPFDAHDLVAIERDPFAMLLFALAAKAHLSTSTEAFENAWWQFAERAQPRLLATCVADGDAAGSWDPSAFEATSRIRLTATLGWLTHQFRECRERAPRAWTKTLHAALAGADRLVVRSGRKAVADASPPLLDLADAKAVADFVRRIEINGARSGGWVCACGGEPFLEFRAGDRLLATVGMHHGRSLRWHGGVWRSDAALELQSAQFVNAWLAARGVEGPQREVEDSRQSARRAELAEARWRAAMPASLQPLWPSMRDWRRTEQRLGEMRTALTLEQPDAMLRIRMLLEWFGSGTGLWSGYPTYEGVAETLLFDFETKQVIAAMDGTELTDRQLEGAARFFASWQFSSARAAELGLLSETWRRKLLARGLEDADADRIARARHAFEK